MPDEPATTAPTSEITNETDTARYIRMVSTNGTNDIRLLYNRVEGYEDVYTLGVSIVNSTNPETVSMSGDSGGGASSTGNEENDANAEATAANTSNMAVAIGKIIAPAYTDETASANGSLVGLLKGAFKKLSDILTNLLSVINIDKVRVEGTVNANVAFPSVQHVVLDNQLATQPVSGTVNIGNYPTSQHVTVDNLPSTQAISGSVSVNNLPSTQTIAGSVNVANFPVTQPISGSVAVSNYPTNQTVTVSNYPTSQHVTIDNPTNTVTANVTFPANQSVTVSNFPATQPVSGTVSVGNFPATQPVSGTLAISNFPATQPVSGNVNAVVSGGVNATIVGTPTVNANVTFPTTQAVSGSVNATLVGTPTVNANVIFPVTQPISGNVSATITGTPTVNANVTFPTTQAVSGNVNATVSNFPSSQNVVVTNTPNVAITNTPSVTISGTPNVAITSLPTYTPNVTIGGMTNNQSNTTLDLRSEWIYSPSMPDATVTIAIGANTSSTLDLNGRLLASVLIPSGLATGTLTMRVQTALTSGGTYYDIYDLSGNTAFVVNSLSLTASRVITFDLTSKPYFRYIRFATFGAAGAVLNQTGVVTLTVNLR